MDGLDLKAPTEWGPEKGESVYTLRLKARKVECQVDGCNEPLPKTKAYHRRYRICPYHATLPQMVINGRHVRFCQQCGRFQQLSEFDPGRKSCRKKLESHNLRRKQARAAAAQVQDPSLALMPSERRTRAAAKAEAAAAGNTSTEGDETTTTTDAVHESSPGVSGADYAAHAAPYFGGYGAAPDPKDSLADELDIEALLLEMDSDAGVGAAAAMGVDVDLLPSFGLDDHIGGVDGPGLGMGLTGPNLWQDELMPAPVQPGVVPVAHELPSQITSALAMLNAHHRAAPAVTFEPAADLVRASLKLFNAHPSELPASIFSELQQMMARASTIYDNVRLGCTHITFETLATPEEAAALRARGSKGLLEAAVARGTSVFPVSTFQGPNGRVLAQLGEDVSVVSGEVAVTVRLGVDSLTTPRVSSVVPFAAVPGARRGFTLLGARVAGGQDMVVCRRGAAMPDLEVVRSGAVASGGEEFVEFVLPRVHEGLHFVEVQRGALLSGSAPFVVVDDAAAVAELRQLEYDASGVGDGAAVAAFLRSVGVVLDWRRRQNPVASTSAVTDFSGGSTDGPESAARIAVVAQRVLATCVARGWPALLRQVLPAAVCPGVSAADALESIKSLSAEGFSLLHLVATSRCASTVAVLAEWAASLGHTWRCEGAGPSALTPLHLSALLNDDGAMASALTALFPDGASLWLHQSPACPCSAAAFAAMVRNAPVIGWLEKNGVPCRAMADPAARKLGAGEASPEPMGLERVVSCKDARSVLDGRWASVDAMIRQVEATAWQNPRGLLSLSLQGGCLAAAAGLALYLRVCQA